MSLIACGICLHRSFSRKFREPFPKYFNDDLRSDIMRIRLRFSWEVIFAPICALGMLPVCYRACAAIDWTNPATYGRPVNLGSIVNSSASEQSPSLTGDELTLIFTSGGPGFPSRPGTQGPGGPWMSTRSSTNSPWTTPIHLSALDTADGEIDFSITADGLEIVFARLSGIYSCTRTNLDAPWTSPTLLPVSVNAPNALNAHCTISYDGLTLVFHRELSGTGRGDLFISTRTARSDPWPNAASLPSQINTTGNGESWACLSSDGRSLLFSRYVETDPTTADIYVSTRNSLTSPWKPAIRLPTPVNQPSVVDIAPWLSLDSRRLYFTSNRAGGYGSLDLWVVAVVPQPPQIAITREGTNVVIRWNAGTLLFAPTVTGPYRPLAGATSPYTVPQPGTEREQYYQAVETFP